MLLLFTQQIPEHTEIPNLGASLVKLLQDFKVQVYTYRVIVVLLTIMARTRLYCPLCIKPCSLFNKVEALILYIHTMYHIFEIYYCNKPWNQSAQWCSRAGHGPQHHIHVCRCIGLWWTVLWYLPIFGHSYYYATHILFIRYSSPLLLLPLSHCQLWLLVMEQFTHSSSYYTHSNMG